MNTSATFPTTSDISMFMKHLGFKWSNEAQIYYWDNMTGYGYINRKTAKRLYKVLIGDKPFSPTNLIKE